MFFLILIIFKNKSVADITSIFHSWCVTLFICAFHIVLKHPYTLFNSDCVSLLNAVSCNSVSAVSHLVWYCYQIYPGPVPHESYLYLLYHASFYRIKPGCTAMIPYQINKPVFIYLCTGKYKWIYFCLNME